MKSKSKTKEQGEKKTITIKVLLPVILAFLIVAFRLVDPKPLAHFSDAFLITSLLMLLGLAVVLTKK